MIINEADLKRFSNQHIIIIPIRSFSSGKSRLSSVLSQQQRSELMQYCANSVIGATGDIPTIVISSDPQVQSFALERGKFCLPDPGSTLNQIINNLYKASFEFGISHLTVAHGDLPLARDLTCLKQDLSAVIVPDRHRSGTNVLSIPTGTKFIFSYGFGSLEKHIQQARLNNLQVSLVEDPSLMIDIDMPEDLDQITSKLNWNRKSVAVDDEHKSNRLSE
ncbi:MAG: 2-phospho-L-lactate guanylyltransferase [Actinobacteria bacterium]|nr:2-phospho-L-lactate guanylyltransferase [Actinomycetota bacterium]